ncbi:MAG: hypothetical protein JWO03_2097 [Bacteroidetes bacterium]|nr:hypothetical protein [Bacteroidota bacterium]
MKDIDIAFLFGIITTMAALWYFLYSRIIEITTKELWHKFLWLLTIAHYLIFLCTILALIILYYQFLSSSFTAKDIASFQRLTDIIVQSRKILVMLWAPAIVSCITLPVLGNIFESFNKNKFLVKFGNILSLIITAAIIWPLYGEVLALLNLKTGIIIGVLLLPGLIFYLMILSNISTGIQFTTDK